MTDSIDRVSAEVVRCRRCRRLVDHREAVARQKRRAYREWDYWGRPVPACGDPRGRLVLIGLAPGAHGSNRTGRMFTGDASGDTLFAALHRYGFASSPHAVSRDDGLRLTDCFITAAVRCAPPGNKPTREEFATCLPFLVRELELLRRARVYLALGRLAFDWTLKACAHLGWMLDEERPAFGHGARFRFSAKGRSLLCSYHPSRQNTQTGRLTPAMFHAVFAGARRAILTGS